MRENMTQDQTQDQRLDYLVEEFKADSGEYKDLKTPSDTEGKRRVLRSLMNIRMPRQMDKSVIAVQDEYLQERIRENGIVALEDIPEIQAEPFCLAGRHHTSGRGCHRQCSQFADAGLFRSYAHLHR